MRAGAATGCHQLPERSFFFRQYQFPVCARCCGVLIGESMAIAAAAKKCDVKPEISLLAAETMFLELVKQMAAREGVTEQLKVQDQMLWVQRMNNIRNRAMEVVNNDLIYA